MNIEREQFTIEVEGCGKIEKKRERFNGQDTHSFEIIHACLQQKFVAQDSSVCLARNVSYWRALLCMCVMCVCDVFA